MICPNTGTTVQSGMNVRSEIRELWSSCDILVCYLDMDRHSIRTESLTDNEIITLSNFKSEYFQKRYVLSRTLLKHLLCNILETRSPSEVVLSPSYGRRVQVNNGDYPWISLSYSQNVLASFLAKERATGDVEVIRLSRVHPSKYPALTGLGVDEVHNTPRVFWERWTQLEACAKFKEVSLQTILRDVSFGLDLRFHTFAITDRVVGSVCSMMQNPRISLIYWKGNLFEGNVPRAYKKEKDWVNITRRVFHNRKCSNEGNTKV